jgi:hypothetical protein
MPSSKIDETDSEENLAYQLRRELQQLASGLTRQLREDNASSRWLMAGVLLLPQLLWQLNLIVLQGDPWLKWLLRGLALGGAILLYSSRSLVQLLRLPQLVLIQLSRCSCGVFYLADKFWRWSRQQPLVGIITLPLRLGGFSATLLLQVIQQPLQKLNQLLGLKPAGRPLGVLGRIMGNRLAVLGERLWGNSSLLGNLLEGKRGKEKGKTSDLAEAFEGGSRKREKDDKIRKTKEKEDPGKKIETVKEKEGKEKESKGEKGKENEKEIKKDQQDKEGKGQIKFPKDEEEKYKTIKDVDTEREKKDSSSQINLDHPQDKSIIINKEEIHSGDKIENIQQKENNITKGEDRLVERLVEKASEDKPWVPQFFSDVLSLAEKATGIDLNRDGYLGNPEEKSQVEKAESPPEDSGKEIKSEIINDNVITNEVTPNMENKIEKDLQGTQEKFSDLDTTINFEDFNNLLDQDFSKDTKNVTATKEITVDSDIIGAEKKDNAKSSEGNKPQENESPTSQKLDSTSPEESNIINNSEYKKRDFPSPVKSNSEKEDLNPKSPEPLLSNRMERHRNRSKGGRDGGRGL